MATSITMPQLGESVTEGTVTRWLKKEGEWVAKDEPLLEVMTDKVNAEIPSPVAGLLSKIVVAEGIKVAVGEELAVVEEGRTKEVGGQEPEAQRAMAVESTASATPHAAPVQREMAAAVSKPDISALSDEAGPGGGRYSPLVRRLAREHGIDLAAISGTGIGGRVTKEDVLKFVSDRQTAPPPGKTEFAKPEPPRVEFPAAQHPPAAATQQAVGADEEIVVPTPMRLAIAEHMVRSAQTAPHAWTLIEVDMTNLVRRREQVKAEFERREGVALTYLPFVIQAVVEALKEVPIMNSAWVHGKIAIKKQINVGVAVALEQGLIVPVLRNADHMSIAGLAKATADLANRARAGRLTPADVQGGTFTVNNPGAFGSVLSMPIINGGQAAILAMEAVVKRPVVRDDAIAIRSMMNLGLSFDHRVVDGLTAGRFLQAIRKRLETDGAETPLY